MKKGKLLVFSAPSGSGKTTIVKYLREKISNLHFSVSATTRAPRGTEKDGVDYFFISFDEFQQKLKNQEFVEYQEVYGNTFYGTLKSQIKKQLENGENVILDIDVLGGVNVKKIYKDDVLTVFVQPPSIEELRRRLEKRGTDSPEVIQKRIDKAEYEMTFAPQFDKIVINDNLDIAQAEALNLVTTFLEQ